MRNSERTLGRGARWALALATLFASIASASTARAQQPARPVQGFGVERFYPSAPGAGWLVMDTLTMHGGLGGSAAIGGDYAHNPLTIASSGAPAQPLHLVSDQAFADFGFGVTYDRIRLSVNFTAPVLSKGNSGTVGGHSYTAPSFDLGSNPDTLTDVRLGFVARVVGDFDAPFRVGLGAQLFVPSGEREDYVTDHTYRAMGRVLVAGDLGHFSYAGHVGLHIRPLDNTSEPGSPQGSEMIFGAAAGASFPVCVPGGCNKVAMIIGPEVFGATALDSFFTTTGTALEALLSTRFEGTHEYGPQLRFKLGAGGGLNPHFGAPDARVVFGIEVFDRTQK